MKRANCLYRVSTKKQVSVVSEFGTLKDDIPMQKQACREFHPNGLTSYTTKRNPL